MARDWESPDRVWGIEGTEDWHLVAEVSDGVCYEWDEMLVYYSPSARRYFIASGGGNSCNSLSDDYYTISDFRDGDQAWAADKVRDFAVAHLNHSPMQAMEAAARVRNFRPGA